MQNLASLQEKYLEGLTLHKIKDGILPHKIKEIRKQLQLKSISSGSRMPGRMWILIPAVSQQQAIPSL